MQYFFVGFTLAGIFCASLPLNCTLHGSFAIMSTYYLLWFIIHTNLLIILSPHCEKNQYYSQESPSSDYC